MKRTLTWSLATALVLAGAHVVSAQTAWTQPRLTSGNLPQPAPQVTSRAIAHTTPTLPIISPGSSITYGGANAPDTYTATTTFSSTPVLVDNGAVKIWQQQTPTGSNGEWDVFYMQTVNGGPLAGNINGDWNIVISYTLNEAVFFDQVVNQWLVNGTPVNPLSGIGSICCASATNPILPGEAFYNSGFQGALPAGVQTNWRQVYVDPYSLVSSGGVNPSTANEFIFALHFTIQPPPPVVLSAISASAFGAFPTFAPGSWIEIYGTNLALNPQTWASTDFSGVNGPTKLGGTTVTIGGQSAFIDYVSPLQVNVQVPGNVSTGSQSLVVTTGVGSSAPFPVTVDATVPGLLDPPGFKIGSTQYVVAQFSDNSYVLPPGALSGITSERAKPGDEIVIYGIGFGPVLPDIQPGQLVQQSNSLVEPLTISFGGTAAHLDYYGLAPNYMGLYQFNVTVPQIAPSDSVPLTFSLGGTAGAQTLAIAIGN